MSTIDNLAVFIECSTGSTPTVQTVKKYIDYTSLFGYNQIYLGVTDAYKIPEQPYFNYNRGGYTKEQFQEIDSYAAQHGMELRVNFQTLGHLEHLLKYNIYREIRDTNDILMVGEEKSYEIIDQMFASLSASVSSRTIHIGMDEAWTLGLGNYLKKNGFHEKQEILLYHLNRVVEIAKKYGYICEMWTDMFFRLIKGSDFDQTGVVPTEVKEMIPENVRLVHWYYREQHDLLYSQLQAIQSISNDVAMAGAVHKSAGLAPMNAFSIHVMEKQIDMCRQMDISHYFVTLWSNYGAHCSIFSALPGVYAASEFVKGKTIEQIDKARFKEIVGLDFDSFMLLDYMNNPLRKENWTLNNRCQWGLFMDMLLPYYDALVSEGIGKAYEKLSEQYENVEAGEFQPIFNNFINLAKVLSIKMEISTKIRQAYQQERRDLLRQYAEIDIPKMIQYMEKYIEQFEKYWLGENMAYGLEYHHHYDGGLIRRWKSVSGRILNYLNNDMRIEELEHESLPPCDVSKITEDTFLTGTYQRLISFCDL